MREHKHETIIIEREAYYFLTNNNRAKKGYAPLSQDALDKAWRRPMFNDNRNGGANPATHPISGSEVRIYRYSFCLNLQEVCSLLSKNGFKWRQDGFCFEEFGVL